MLYLEIFFVEQCTSVTTIKLECRTESLTDWIPCTKHNPNPNHNPTPDQNLNPNP